MEDSVEKTEHYIVVKASSHRLDVIEAQRLLHLVQTEQEKETISYVLLDLDGVTDFDFSAFEVISVINEICNKNLGLLLCFNGKEEWMDSFSEHGFVLVPTKHEAIEYVFMDQLEKQFLSDEI